MKTNRILFLFFVLILVVNISYSFQTNSSNYRQSPLIVSSGGEIVNSGSYKNYVATGIIAGVINSSTYKNWLGFFYGWLLADGQPCTAGNQCEGGFCCSNVCSSSSCPTTTIPSAAPGGGGGGGGGAGGIRSTLPKLEDFSISPSNVKVRLVLGSATEEILTIKNTGDATLGMSLIVEGVDEYLFLSNNSFNLKPGETTAVTLNFIGKEVGAFTGQIIVNGGGIKKSVPIIIEVISEIILFDVKLDIPHPEVYPGDDLETQVTILNVGLPEKVDVIVTYLIKDLRGAIIYEETETFAVETQISYPKSFKIHEQTEPDDYVMIAEVLYDNSFAVSSKLFRVLEKKATVNITLMLLLMFILVGLIVILIYKLVSIRKKRKAKKRK